MVQAERACLPTLQVHFGDFIHAGHISAKHVLDRAQDAQAALLGGGQHMVDNVQCSVVGSAGLFQNRVAIVLGMWCGVVAPMEEVLVRLLHAVVGEGLPGNLPPGQPAPVRKRRQVNRIDGPSILQEVEHVLGSLIHEGYGADLDTDGLAARCRFRCGRGRGIGQRPDRRETRPDPRCIGETLGAES